MSSTRSLTKLPVRRSKGATRSFMLACVLGLSFSAQAARRKKTTKVQKPPETTQVDVHIDVPKSQIDLGGETVAPPPVLNLWGLSLSSFVPRRIAISSYVPGTSEFRRRAMPLLSFDHFSYLYYSPTFQVRDRLGLSYVQLHRSAAATSGYTSSESSQSLHFLAVIMGAEFHDARLNWKVLSPYAQINLLPAVALTPRSKLEQGSTSLGLYYDLKVGTQIAIFNFSNFDPSAVNRYFLNLAGGIVGGSLRSSQKIEGLFEGGIQASF